MKAERTEYEEDGPPQLYRDRDEAKVHKRVPGLFQFGTAVHRGKPAPECEGPEKVTPECKVLGDGFGRLREVAIQQVADNDRQNSDHNAHPLARISVKACLAKH